MTLDWTIPMIAVLAALPVPAVATAGEKPVEAHVPHDDSGLERSVVEGANAFAVDLYRSLASGREGNLFLSPASIHTALSMTYAGAGGRTAEQMANVLHLPPGEAAHSAYGEILGKLDSPKQMHGWDPELDKTITEPAYELVVANALWGQDGYPFEPSFTRLVEKHYGAALSNVDFVRAAEAARKTINEWVEKRTEDRIQDLIPPGALGEMTRLVLTNAIYFKSRWAEQFSERKTRNGDFRLAGGGSVEVPMMHQQGTFGYVEAEGLQALELPYEAGELSMVVVLPRAVDGLAALEKDLSAERLAGWSGGLKREEVRVTLPKWKATGRFGLAEALRSMGMTDAFAPGSADFSGMTKAEKPFLSAVVHKAFVEVDEEGTEAAAATAVAVAGTAMPVEPPEPKVFEADRPFLFLIRHSPTDLVLFVGRIADPR
jgi:serpin B